MKSTIYLLGLLLLASCGTTPSRPGSTTPAPTVTPLAPVVRPSVEKAAPLVRETSKGVSDLRRENDKLNRLVGESRETNATLSSTLAEAIEEGSATKEKLEQIEGLANIEKALNEALLLSVQDQNEIIAQMEAVTALLESEVQVLGEDIAVANQRLEDTSAQLAEANERIVQMAEARNEAVTNAAEWKAEVDVAQGHIEAERTWKRRYRNWAIAVTALICVYIFLRINPKTSLFIP